MMTDEKELVLRAQKDVAAFEAVYDRYFPEVFRFVMHRTGDRDITEEVVANVFFKAMRKIGLFRWKSIPFSAWLYRIAANEIANHYRAEKRRRNLDRSLTVESEVAPSTSEDPFSYEFIHTYLRQLPQADQNLITLRYFEKKDYAELASIFGKRESTLRVNLHRALRKLEHLIPREELENVYQKVSGQD
jgi:RNA polymerase sigma-70 factor (ECF subfamily)